MVFSGTPARREEARRAAERVTAGAKERQIIIHEFRDGFFPYIGADIKRSFEQLKQDVQPDLIFTHCRGDLHQDHRLHQRTHLEHLSQPSDPGIRNPQIRRRSRDTRIVCATAAGAVRP